MYCIHNFNFCYMVFTSRLFNGFNNCTFLSIIVITIGHPILFSVSDTSTPVLDTDTPILFKIPGSDTSDTL
jgi:hypothetical protein